MPIIRSVIKNLFKCLFPLILLTLIFLAYPPAASATYYSPYKDPRQNNSNAVPACYDGCGTAPLNDCTTFGDQIKANECSQVPWTFKYASSCWVCPSLSGPQCTFQYFYSYNTCNTEDRCYGSNTGASGYDAAGRIQPGICNAAAYDGVDPNSACVSGGNYKQCCSNPSPGVLPTTACSMGVCPSGFKTSPGDTSCDTPCPPDGSCSANPACNTTATGVDNCGNSCTKSGPACAPQACVPFSQGPVCDTAWCPGGTVCGQGHQYCLWDGSGYGACSEEVNNCATQCVGPAPDPGVCNYNGAQDNGETGIDCGGGNCPACPSGPPPGLPDIVCKEYASNDGGVTWTNPLINNSISARPGQRVDFKMEIHNSGGSGWVYATRNKFDEIISGYPNIIAVPPNVTDPGGGVIWNIYDAGFPGISYSDGNELSGGQTVVTSWWETLSANPKNFKNKGYATVSTPVGGSVYTFGGCTIANGVKQCCYTESESGGVTCHNFPDGCDPTFGGGCPYTGTFNCNAVTVNVSYPVAGYVKDSQTGNGISGVTVIIQRGDGDIRTVTTGGDGKFLSENFVFTDEAYAVRIDNSSIPAAYAPVAKPTTTGWSWRHTTVNERDTNPNPPYNDRSYETQVAGSNDCAGPDNGGNKGRCNFALDKLSPPTNLSKSCSTTGTTLSWNAASGAESYIIRVKDYKANSPYWIDYNDFLVQITASTACSGSTCSITTPISSSSPNTAVYFCPIQGRTCVDGEYRPTANIIMGTPYSFSVQTVGSGGVRGGMTGEVAFTCTPPGLGTMYIKENDNETSPAITGGPYGTSGLRINDPVMPNKGSNFYNSLQVRQSVTNTDNYTNVALVGAAFTGRGGVAPTDSSLYALTYSASQNNGFVLLYAPNNISGQSYYKPGFPPLQKDFYAGNFYVYYNGQWDSRSSGTSWANSPVVSFSNLLVVRAISNSSPNGPIFYPWLIQSLGSRTWGIWRYLQNTNEDESGDNATLGNGKLVNGS